MSVIVNIRGTNGSGKSTAATRYMETIGVEEELKQGGKTWAYRLRNGVSVLGRYTTACGGCDTVKTFADVKDGVTALARLGAVIFEGVLWSTCFKPSVELAQSLPQHHFIFGMLDTTADECLRRVLVRRKQAGNEKPFDPTKQQKKHVTIARIQRRLEAAGFDARLLPHGNAFATIEAWFGESQEQTPDLEAMLTASDK